MVKILLAVFTVLTANIVFAESSSENTEVVDDGYYLDRVGCENQPSRLISESEYQNQQNLFLNSDRTKVSLSAESESVTNSLNSSGASAESYTLRLIGRQMYLAIPEQLTGEMRNFSLEIEEDEETLIIRKRDFLQQKCQGGSIKFVYEKI